MKRLKIVLLVFVGLYMFGGVGLYLLQERFIFMAEVLPADFVFNFDVPFREVNLNRGSANLHGLCFMHEHGDRKGVILYYHGNAQSLERWGQTVQYHYNLGYDVVVMDYRGYGKSTGERTEQNLLDDAQAFYDYTKTLYSESEITVYGRSLGTGFATYVASKNDPLRLILETPFHDFESLAQRYYPIFPVGVALRFNFKSNEYVKGVRCPIYIFHGTDDRIVPYSHGRKLYETIPEDQAEFITIPEGEHVNLVEFEKFRREMERVLD